jgi:hypothetical protein
LIDRRAETRFVATTMKIVATILRVDASRRL